MPDEIGVRAKECLDAFLGQAPKQDRAVRPQEIARLLDRAMLPKCAMDHVVCHWSEGHYKPNDTDLAHHEKLLALLCGSKSRNIYLT